MLQGQTPSREGPSCLFQPWLQVSWAVAVSLSPVQVCVSPVVAISLCLSLIKTLVLDLGPTWIIQVISSQGPSSHLQRPFLQIRPHSEVLGLGHGHTFWGPSCSPGGCEESASRSKGSHLLGAQPDTIHTLYSTFTLRPGSFACGNVRRTPEGTDTCNMLHLFQ